MERTCPICNNTINSLETSCPYCGYSFTESTQRFEPLSLNNNNNNGQCDIKKHNSYGLYLVSGPQTDIDFALTQEVTSIGRDPQCDIFLNDMTVSRLHAHVESHENGHIIKDMNSYNGVWVNNKNIDLYTLSPDDVIQIGAFCFVYYTK